MLQFVNSILLITSNAILNIMDSIIISIYIDLVLFCVKLVVYLDFKISLFKFPFIINFIDLNSVSKCQFLKES